MADRLQMYDSMRGMPVIGYIAAGNGFATVSGKKKEHWSKNIFANWRRKGKPGNEDEIITSQQQQQQQQMAKWAYNSVSAASAVYYYADSVPHPVYDTRFMQTDTINATVRRMPKPYKRANIMYTAWDQYPSAEHTVNNSNCTCSASAVAPIPAMGFNVSKLNSNQMQLETIRCKSPALLESSHKMSTVCKKKSATYSKKSSLKQLKCNRGNDTIVAGTKSVSFSTVNERVLRVLRKSAKDPFNSITSKKSILECELTAYDLIKQQFSESEDDLSDNAIDAKDAKREREAREARGEQDTRVNQTQTVRSQRKSCETNATQIRHPLSAHELHRYSKNRSALAKLKNGSSQSLRIGGQGVHLYRSPFHNNSNNKNNNECRKVSLSSPATPIQLNNRPSQAFPLPEPDYSDGDADETIRGCDSTDSASESDDAKCGNDTAIVNNVGETNGAIFGCTSKRDQAFYTQFNGYENNYAKNGCDDDSSVKSILKKTSNADFGNDYCGNGSSCDLSDGRIPGDHLNVSVYNTVAPQLKIKKHVHFRAYYDDTLIVDQIEDTILEENEEQDSIYDDCGQQSSSSKSDRSETSDDMSDNSLKCVEKFKNVFDSISAKSSKKLFSHEMDTRNIFGDEHETNETRNRCKSDIVQKQSSNSQQQQLQQQQQHYSHAGHKISRIAILEALQRSDENLANLESVGEPANNADNDYDDNSTCLESVNKDYHQFGNWSERNDENDTRNECVKQGNDDNFRFTVSISNPVNNSERYLNNKFDTLCSLNNSSSLECLANLKSKTNDEFNRNKVVIDVHCSNHYESLNTTAANEHIYETIDVDSIYGNRCDAESPAKSMFDGASRDEILEYLQGARERVEILINCNDNDNHLDTNCYSAQKLSHKINITNNVTTTGVTNNRRNRTSNVSNSSTDSAVTTISTDSMETEDESIKCTITNLNTRVERNDSGVGIETSKPHRIRRSSNTDLMNEGDHQCADCEHIMDPCRDEQSQLIFYSLVCEKCEKKRNERKEIISEFVDTEFKYGRDLRITREEFYKPMQVAGLLTKEQLKSVFLNLDQLIEVNSVFSAKLQDAVDIAIEQGDEDFTTVNIGKLFMESSEMLSAFETYCVEQGNASVLLNHLEKEKELLRVFLRVSQMENTLLRRMNLSAFLMVPVQRVTKYPLLLNRLYKVTPYQHKDRDALREAQQKVEMHLEHINQQTKGTGAPTRIWRRISRIWRPLLPAFTSNLLLGFT